MSWTFAAFCVNRGIVGGPRERYYASAVLWGFSSDAVTAPKISFTAAHYDHGKVTR